MATRKQAASADKKPKRTGNRPLEKKQRIADPETLVCDYCNQRLDKEEFYLSDSDFYNAVGRIPYCKSCVVKLYDLYYDKYYKMGMDFPERRAIERLCMAFDMYYSDKIFDSVVKYIEEKKPENTIPAEYFKMVKMYQYREKDYDTTLRENYNISQRQDNSGNVVTSVEDLKTEEYAHAKDGEVIFGKGYQRQDYLFLYNQYMDWTARHECKTKVQEELFKEICLTQLELSKAHKLGQDTKDLNMTLMRQMEAAKLQPKQNSGETLSDTQTFGTLIAKWETTRPLPEVDEELRDVDKIGLYIDVFFKGHMAKMLNLKSAFSKMYDKFMEKYTVTKPEYSVDENNEVLYDAIFGDDSSDDEGVV